MNKIPTVTIGITARNEERDIVRLLKSINKQDMRGYCLEKILCISDGSTDKTASLLHTMKQIYKNIEILEYKISKGKPTRLNQIYRLNRSDILVTLDADIHLCTKKTILHLISPFSDPKIGLVGGNDQPIRSDGFIRKVILAGIDMWYEMRKDINKGDTIHNIHGAIVALSKSFVSKIELPKNVIAEDTYLYLLAKKLRYGFTFAQRANVLYRPSQNLKDFFTQHSRYLFCHNEMQLYFQSSDRSLFSVPLSYKLRGVFKVIVNKPILGLMSIILNFLVRIFRQKFYEEDSSLLWKRISSTKGGALV